MIKKNKLPLILLLKYITNKQYNYIIQVITINNKNLKELNHIYCELE
jgi:hypothetical protein